MGWNDLCFLNSDGGGRRRRAPPAANWQAADGGRDPKSQVVWCVPRDKDLIHELTVRRVWVGQTKWQLSLASASHGDGRARGGREIPTPPPGQRGRGAGARGVVVTRATYGSRPIRRDNVLRGVK